MNEQPGDDAIDLIATKIKSTRSDVAEWFRLRRTDDNTNASLISSSKSINLNNNLNNNNSKDFHLQSSLVSVTNNNNNTNTNSTTTTNAISCPSSTLLAKLNVVTSRPNAHILAQQLDSKMIELLEAFYAINDNPEPGAVEMIARRLNVNIDLISNWFDKKRLKVNPFAGPRSPPAKKREGGRVVTFSEYQRSLLEAIFDENNYLHPQEYEELSNLIQVPSRNIKIWFKNRRSKQRNHCKCDRTSSAASVSATTSVTPPPLPPQQQQHHHHEQQSHH